MYGAILGDIIGEPYEWHNMKSKGFPLFRVHTEFTDDTVMTIAVAEALMLADDTDVIENETATKEIIIDCMHKWGHRYPNAGYGGRFRQWLRQSEREPYNSWGNGSAMRVSSAGWLYNNMDAVRRVARWTAEVTHDHPEGVKGAEAIASAVLLARSGCTKQGIKEYIEKQFAYDLNRTCDEIRPCYKFDVSCQGSVPEAIIAFLDSTDFEDAIRNAVSLGGDSDTIGAMTGAIAEAYYCIPYDLMDKCEEILPPDLRAVLVKFSEDYQDEIYMNMPESVRNSVSSNHRSLKKEDILKEYKRISDMPDQHEEFILCRHFNNRQLEMLKQGHIAKEMEDKWHWYMEGDSLYAHRSWTGFCIYRVDFKSDDKHVVAVNRDPRQYNSTSIGADAKMIASLLTYWTRPNYDYYGEWLMETYNALKKAGRIE